MSLERHRLPWRVVLATIALAGCQRGPSAPPLQSLEEGRLFKDDREGVRFFAPEGWKQTGRSLVPPGQLKAEHMLVEYKSLGRDLAVLQVSVADLDEKEALADYLIDNRASRQGLTLAEPPEKFQINDVPAVRIVLHEPSKGKNVMVHDIVAFRRGTRVYFFEGTCAATDTRSRRDIKATVDSIVW